MSWSAMPTDEQLLAEYYQCDFKALDALADRYHTLLSDFGRLMLIGRTGNPVQAAAEWDLDERIDNVWALVTMTKLGNLGRRPQHVSVLVWLVHLLCREVDRHLGISLTDGEGHED